MSDLRSARARPDPRERFARQFFRMVNPLARWMMSPPESRGVCRDTAKYREIAHQALTAGQAICPAHSCSGPRSMAAHDQPCSSRVTAVRCGRSAGSRQARRDGRADTRPSSPPAPRAGAADHAHDQEPAHHAEAGRMVSPPIDLFLRERRRGPRGHAKRRALMPPPLISALLQGRSHPSRLVNYYQRRAAGISCPAPSEAHRRTPAVGE
jgi:hypothetical protein